MDKNQFDSIEAKLFEFKHLGFEEDTHKTKLIGHLPKIAPYAWLHQIFSPLGHSDIKKMEEELSINLPPTLKPFFSFANGLNIFSNSLSIYGMRRPIKRSELAFEPFEIKTPNLFERPRDAKSEYFFIGGYNWDGSLLFINTEDGKVYRCLRNSAKKLNQWDDLFSMLSSEIDRLKTHFDQNGYEINEEVPTTPSSRWPKS